ncbi:MAG: TonB-dependent receptor [Burkholderiaceae bacterium]|nr:TonB-dependent receptor [Burkholderiaceae bacterium]
MTLVNMHRSRWAARLAVDLAFVGLLGAMACAAWAQEAQRVEITGSSIRRIDAETALPVQVLTREDIARTGAVNVEQLLQTVSAITSSGGITAASVSGATTGGLSSISLRGLSSIRTLVLLNGRRIAPYGVGFTGDSVSVDVNSIPLAAIERVEVLKDGASAVYGSDAIAGVVNFILRRDYAGLELSAQFGDTSDGGAASRRAGLLWGTGNLERDGFNVMVGVMVQKETALFGRDRAFAASGTNLEAENDTTSGNTFPANFAAADGSFGGSFNPSVPNCPGPYSSFIPFRSTTSCRFDPAPLIQLIPEAERASIYGSANLKLGAGLEGYLQASYNRNKQNNIIQPVPLSDQFNIPLNNPLATLAPYNTFTPFPASTILLTSASPFYPTAFVQGITGGATPDLLVRYRAGESGNRDITDTSESPRLVAGVKGAAAGWDFDAGMLHSKNKLTEKVNDGFPVLSRLMPLLNSGNVNFFGPNTADVVAQIRAANFTGTAFEVVSQLDSVQAKATRDLLQMPDGALALALGVELRHEQYRFDASTEISTGDVSGYGGNFGDTDRSRRVESVFGEVNVPLAKGLEGTAAVRFDRYQGVGNSTTPKLSLRWQVVPQWVLRGSVGKGFRAPSLQDLYLPSQIGVTAPGLSDPIRCPVTGDEVRDCGTQFQILNQGTPTLRPERSVSSTLGTVVEPARDLTIAADYFRINMKDQINNGITPAVILADAASLAKYASLVQRGPVDPAFPALPGPISLIDQSNLNIGRILVAGIDYDARWRLPAGDWGRLTLSTNGTYFHQYDAQNPDGSYTGAISQVNGATGGVVPRWKTTYSANLTRGAWSGTLVYNWQSGYYDLLNSPFFDLPQRRVGNYETVDAQLQWSGMRDLQLTLGVRNLFNRAPPYTNAGGQTSFQSGYDPQYADPRGRFIYIAASYAFR